MKRCRRGQTLKFNLILQATVQHGNVWGGTVVASGVPDAGWSTIKWENASVASPKPSTVNTAGLQFVSAPPGSVTPVANITMNVIHGGRRTNPIIETFKCELCNQVRKKSGKWLRLKSRK